MRNPFIPVSVQVGADTRYQISACAVPCGKDLSVIIHGGTHPHVGAVTAISPAPGSSESQSIVFPGHRDNHVSDMFAVRLSQEFQCNVSVTAGIHIDNASSDEIQLLLQNSTACCEALIQELKENRPSEYQRL